MTDLDREHAARRAVVAAANAPKDYYRHHSTDCGTKYRGCAPDCPKDIWERTGVWTGAHQATCPTCGALLPASTPAADPPKDVSGDRGVVQGDGWTYNAGPIAPDANVTDENAPSGYMTRPKML